MSKSVVELLRKSNIIGSVVEITYLDDDDEGEVHFDKSVVVNVDFREPEQNSILRLKKCKVGTKAIKGIQEIPISQISDLKVLEEGDGVVNVKANNVTSVATTRNDRSLNTRPIGSYSIYRNDNPHLKKMLPVEMPELLQQKQFDLPPPLKVLDEAGKPRKIFEPKQDPTHMEGGKYSEKCLKELAVIRDKVWIDRDTPPKLKLFPSKWYFIQDLESDKDVLEVALNQLRKQEQVIGVALRGKKGHIFDLALKEILESTTITKVFYDCRCSADLLLRCYNVQLRKVYDIQATHSIFLTWAYTAGYLPKFTYSLPHIARAYLGIQTSFLFFEKYRLDHIEEDTSIWLKRPFSPDLEFGILCDVVYLLDLRRLTTAAMMSPVKIVTDIFLSTFRDDDSLSNAGQVAHQNMVLPNEAIAALPKWEPDERAARNIGFVHGHSVYQAVGQMDPVLIFSRDVMHQNKSLKSNN